MKIIVYDKATPFSRERLFTVDLLMDGVSWLSCICSKNFGSPPCWSKQQYSACCYRRLAAQYG